MQLIRLLFTSQKFIVQMSISLAAILMVAVALLVLRHDITVRTRAVEQARSELSHRIRSLEVFSLLKSQSAEARQYAAVINRTLPSKDELVSFPKTLEQLAGTHGVGIDFSFNTEVAPTNTSPGLITFTLVAFGSYNNIADFLGEFDTISYVVAFDTFDVAASQNGFRGTFQGKIFHR